MIAYLPFITITIIYLILYLHPPKPLIHHHITRIGVLHHQKFQTTKFQKFSRMLTVVPVEII